MVPNLKRRGGGVSTRSKNESVRQQARVINVQHLTEKEENKMKKWLIGGLLALLMVAPAFAGEDPYIAVVGNDFLANPFYLSPKYQQFTYDQQVFGVPVCVP